MNGSGLLALMQWLSPSFPVGSYAYSQGMEAAVDRGLIPDTAATERWLAALLAEGSGFADTVLMCHAMAPAADLAALSDLALALAPGRERYEESRDLGAAFTRIANSLLHHDRPAMPARHGGYGPW